MFRKIENWVLICFVVVIFIASFFNFGVTVTIPQFLYSLAFLFFGMLFLYRVMGAGDIKLIFVFMLVVNTKYYMLFLVSTLFLGGVLAIIYMIKNAYFVKETNREGIPYGIPISISGYVLLIASL